MKKILFSLMAGLLVLGGCSQSEEEKTGKNDEVPQIIEAVIEAPETINPGGEAALAVTVKQGGEAVTDADEVKFEIWQEGQKENGEMIEAKHGSEGKYTADHVFTEEGLYYVQSHVTARSQHTMPMVSIQVGKAKAEDSGTGHDQDDEGHEEGHSHGHGGEVSIELQAPEQIQANEQTQLSAMVDNEGEPLADAKVKLEISLNGDTPQWVNMSETEPGKYTAGHQFIKAGTYIITTHVEKGDDIHEHTETELTVH
ncbi:MULTISPECIES: FixH family protein [Cytobacillus]|uniref:FixH family protein n=1 Tax=Cytobacillus TaxID=2675230 RepID=UPI002041609C|nr:FixH family protein [Cytobacillus firmus]MCM3705556.1 FixH family protein [Cytobacillus firmus]